MLFSECPNISDWSAKDVKQEKMSSFGGSYKKSSEIEQTGRTQKPLTQTAFRTAVDEMMNIMTLRV